MLQRIIGIKNVGRFLNCAAAGDVTLRRYTMIFAENARGKTTLCDILRSLSKNDPSIVIGRRTLGSQGQPEIQILTAAGLANFRNGAWSGPVPDLAVFDSTYIKENVFAGDSVDTEHRRNLYRIIIGAQGINLAAQVTGLDEQIRQKNGEIRDCRNTIQRHIPAGLTIDAFLVLGEDPQIDARIVAKEQELQAARQAAQLQQKVALSPLMVPAFPAALTELLGRTFTDIAADAEQHVHRHVAQHGMEAHGEAWIAEGIRYIEGDACPFCNQPIAAVELIRDYRSYFSQQYNALREEINQLRRQVENVTGERTVTAATQTLQQNRMHAESWRQFCDVVAPEFPNEDQFVNIFGAIRESALALLDDKARAPLEPITTDGRFTEALTAFDMTRAAIDVYNTAIAAANEVISARKRQAQAANARQLEAELAALRAQRIRHSPEVAPLCADETRLQGEKTQLETQKATVRAQLDTHTEQVIAQYGQRINWYLERINASFRITTPTHTYRGGPPSTSYQILINQQPVDLGAPDTPADRPSFRNTLSGGDRNTLALAFFFAQLEQDPNRANKVVVFDDPFGSMDGFRRSHTVNQIFRCGQNCAQIVVLSHDPNFLHLLWERIAPADRKTLSLVRIGEENTTVIDWDIERAVQARYKADLEALMRFYTEAYGDRREIIQKIRPTLEAYCRHLYPTQFADQEMMGGIIGIIRGEGPAHPLHPIVDDLDDLNVYCRRYHHGENPNAATERVDDTELQGFVGRTLRLVGCLT